MYSSCQEYGRSRPHGYRILHLARPSGHRHRPVTLNRRRRRNHGRRLRRRRWRRRLRIVAGRRRGGRREEAAAPVRRADPLRSRGAGAAPPGAADPRAGSGLRRRPGGRDGGEPPHLYPTTAPLAAFGRGTVISFAQHPWTNRSYHLRPCSHSLRRPKLIYQTHALAPMNTKTNVKN